MAKYQRRHFNSSRSYKRKHARRRRRAATNLVDTMVVVLVSVFLLVAFIFSQLGLEIGQSWIGLLGLMALILLVVFAVAIYLHLRRRARVRALSLAGIDQMGGIEFEYYLAQLLGSRGFSNVKITAQNNDFGVDILANKNGEKWAIQAKRYRGYVGVDAVYQVGTGKDYYKVSNAMVITNSVFSEQAKIMASKSGVTLIDRQQLAAWIAEW